MCRALNRLEEAVDQAEKAAKYQYNGLGHRGGKLEGSPIRIEDDTGRTRESYGYGAFGEDLYGNQGEMQPFGYTGYQMDAVAGTYYAQAREYRAERGRFNSQDIIGGFILFPDTLNRYAYCWNAPIDYVDNDGEFPTIAIGALIGGVVGGIGSIISDVAKGKKINWGISIRCFFRENIHVCSCDVYRIVGGTEMAFLRAIIVAFIVTGVLDLITKRTSKKTDSIDKFVVRAPIDFAALGAIGMVVVIGILIFCEIDGTVIPELVMVIFFMVGIFPGFLLMIAPIEGVWDVIVDDDDITVVKAFVYRRHWKFSKITYGKMKRGGMKVYVEGRTRKAFFVDAMCEHFSNFMERMEKEGKEVIYPEGMEPYTEEEMDVEEEQAED